MAYCIFFFWTLLLIYYPLHYAGDQQLFLCEVSVLVATCEFQALFYTITALLKGTQEHLIPVMAYKETGSTFC